MRFSWLLSRFSMLHSCHRLFTILSSFIYLQIARVYIMYMQFLSLLNIVATQRCNCWTFWKYKKKTLFSRKIKIVKISSKKIVNEILIDHWISAFKQWKNYNFRLWFGFGFKGSSDFPLCVVTDHNVTTFSKRIFCAFFMRFMRTETDLTALSGIKLHTICVARLETSFKSYQFQQWNVKTRWNRC